MQRLWNGVELHADKAVQLAGISISAEDRNVFVHGMVPIVRAAYLDAHLKALGVAKGRLKLPQQARELLPEVPNAPPLCKSVASFVSLLTYSQMALSQTY
jgi:hypothetical protein